ncbi:hypothetical protein CHS0354_033916 [Potamilus streckersoni]|uniref:Uncharacterized protein n=1 Tax=Potamilus streckersoni TaxID=2493646 RepID=A0AAE0RWS5_9BIVA|nr:hypothetical protein CHS0354_033916 [Potamilus streckersoni]
MSRSFKPNKRWHVVEEKCQFCSSGDRTSNESGSVFVFIWRMNITANFEKDWVANIANFVLYGQALKEKRKITFEQIIIRGNRHSRLGVFSVRSVTLNFTSFLVRKFKKLTL